MRRLTEPEMDEAVMRGLSDPDFPQYGYGVALGAALAQALGISEISALELGVAGGNGLLSLEGLAARLGFVTPRVHAIGFDLGSGMPEPRDYRDMPYIWQEGFFAMDETALREQLTEATLFLGDIAITGKEFIASDPATIGFISFDLDYYSSTRAAMSALLGARSEQYLPRTICYFDDTVGPHSEYHSALTGELLAIREFNALNESRQLTPIHGLRHKVDPFDGPWVSGIYVLHLFDHPQYNDYVFPAADRQFPLQPKLND